MHFEQENGLKPYSGPFGPAHFFSQKSKNVTFLGLLQANLMQKIRKKTNGGKYENFCYGQTSEVVDMPSMKLNHAIHSHTVSEYDRYNK